MRVGLKLAAKLALLGLDTRRVSRYFLRTSTPYNITMFFSVFGKLLINIQCSILAKYYGSGFVGLQSSDAIRRHRKVNLKSLFIYIFIEHLEH